MAKASFLQSEINGAMKAAAAAGYTKTRMIKHPDGRLEIIAEVGTHPDSDPSEDSAGLSPFEKWQQGNARKA